MQTVRQFLSGSEANMQRIREYRNGGDGSDGTCDCIGLVIGAVKLAGEKWNGNHGTNWTVRNKMKTFNKINGAASLKEGELVYKAREPGENGWNLPEMYASHPDHRDYYHVGIVRCVQPLVIEHCTTVQGGIKNDNSIGQWKFHGELDIVDYGTADSGEEEKHMAKYIAQVTAKSGKTVNMRSAASKAAAVIAQVPVGDEVNLLEETDSVWAKIEYNGKTGYMMREFLIPVGELDDGLYRPGEDETEPVFPQNPQENTGEKITISLSRELAQDLLAAIDIALN